MHMQPLYRANPFISGKRDGYGGCGKGRKTDGMDVGEDVFARGLCLPSDIKMTEKEQTTVLEILHRCFY